jgi:thiol:disulfide interchange protein
MSKKTILILVLVLVPVAGMVVAAATGWGGDWFAQFPNPQFVIAFALGATVTVLLSVGLFDLVFISSRRGYDDQTEDEQDSDGA